MYCLADIWYNGYETMNYISLKQIAKDSPYSAEYLGLRARQGKLKAVKIGRDWVTTQEWLGEYLNQVSFQKSGEVTIPIQVHRDEEQKEKTYCCPSCGYKGLMIVEEKD